MNNENTLSSDWKLLKFSECIQQLNTGLNPRNHFSLGNGEIKYITAKNLTQSGTIDFSNCDYIDESAKRIINKRSDIKVGDILFSSRAPIGHCHLIKDEPDYFDIGESIFSIRVNKEVVLPEYLCLYLSSTYFIELASKNTTGSIIQEIRIGDLMNTSVIIPPKDTQKCIAKCLNTIDQKVENNNKINAELESMAKTIYDYWFLQFEFPNEEGKPYKSSGGKMVWNEELKREIPEGWSTTTIGDITICHDSERIPLSGKDRENMVGDIPYYGATDIMGYVDKPIFDGDYVLLAEDGSVMDEEGHPILQRVTGRVWVNNHAHVLEPIKKHSCKLLMMFLKDVYVPMIKTGSIQMKINQENMNGITVPNIPDDLKEKINLELCTIEKKQLQIIAENQELTSLRDFLLPMLMNGQVGFKINNRKE